MHCHIIKRFRPMLNVAVMVAFGNFYIHVIQYFLEEHFYFSVIPFCTYYAVFQVSQNYQLIYIMFLYQFDDPSLYMMC